MKVLVLCHGSVNRSPFAAYLLRVLRPDLDVRVRALKPDGAGRRPTPKAFDAAAHIDSTLERAEQSLALLELLRGHRSQPCTREDALDADLTLYMDSGNRRRLEALMRPGDQYRAECLADYDEDATRIPDPNYLSRERDAQELDRIFTLIDHCVRRLAQELPHG